MHGWCNFRGCMGVSPHPPLAHVWGQRGCNGGVGIASASASFLFFPSLKYGSQWNAHGPFVQLGEIPLGECVAKERRKKYRIVQRSRIPEVASSTLSLATSHLHLPLPPQCTLSPCLKFLAHSPFPPSLQEFTYPPKYCTLSVWKRKDA